MFNTSKRLNRKEREERKERKEREERKERQQLKANGNNAQKMKDGFVITVYFISEN